MPWPPPLLVPHGGGRATHLESNADARARAVQSQSFKVPRALLWLEAEQRAEGAAGGQRPHRVDGAEDLGSVQRVDSERSDTRAWRVGGVGRAEGVQRSDEAGEDGVGVRLTKLARGAGYRSQ